MAYTIKAKDLSQMDAAQKDRVLDEIVHAARAPRNGQAAVLDARIRGYEERYEMSSRDLRIAIANHTMRETADIADWLFWLNVSDNHTHGKARSKPTR